LDEFVEDRLIPQYTRGTRRAVNLAYKRYEGHIRRAEERGDTTTAEALRQERRRYPSQDTHDPTYRRLHYLRYADDFILGFIGPKAEAEAIKAHLQTFLRDELKLELHPEKTLITHAQSEHAHFLGYAVSVYHANHKLTRRCGDERRIRSVNGKVRLGIPWGLIEKRIKPYQRRGTPANTPHLLQSSVPGIIQTYQSRYRGLVNYYRYAVDRHRFNKLKYVMEGALVKTLARKLRISVKGVYQRYQTSTTIEGHNYRLLRAHVTTDHGTYTFDWGGIPLTVDHTITIPLKDNLRAFEGYHYYEDRCELVTRLQAHRCELCDAEGPCEVHHVCKLVNLKRRWAGRKAKPWWVAKMIALQRKTLVVCHRCHQAIHQGQPLPEGDR
jgi:hypothetical protein